MSPSPDLLSSAGGERLRAARLAFDNAIAEGILANANGDRNGALTSFQFATNMAATHHGGQFASSQLETLLAQFSPRDLVAGRRKAKIERVLHVCTQVYGIGGHTRAVENWILRDSVRCHDLIVLAQGTIPIAQSLKYAVSKSGGTLHVSGSDPAESVRDLRRLSAAHDFVVLHVHPNDITPIVAFAGMPGRPPIALLNHADHCFWVGTSIVDTVVNVRPSGMDLTLRRRGVSMDQSLLLPVPLKPAKRRLSREDAKARLGIPPDAIVYLSIGSNHKYRPLGSLDFVDAHAEVLRAFPNTRIILVGPSPISPYWQRRSAEMGDRLMIVPATPELSPYHDAADIYIDGVPCGSVTALLEAAMQGTPAVSWGVFEKSTRAGVFRADDVALSDFPFSFALHREYLNQMAELTVNDRYRHDLGVAMAAAIRRMHVDDWQRACERVYEQTAMLAQSRASRQTASIENPDEYDVVLSLFQQLHTNPSL